MPQSHTRPKRGGAAHERGVDGTKENARLAKRKRAAEGGDDEGDAEREQDQVPAVLPLPDQGLGDEQDDQRGHGEPDGRDRRSVACTEDSSNDGWEDLPLHVQPDSGSDGRDPAPVGGFCSSPDPLPDPPHDPLPYPGDPLPADLRSPGDPVPTASTQPCPDPGLVAIRVSVNASGVVPKFERLDHIKQRTPEWLELKKGKTGERVGSSSSGEIVGAGKGEPATKCYYVSFEEQFDEPFRGNMFTERGSKFEPCLRRLHEYLANVLVYDGGYWIPKDPETREMIGDSPDAVLAIKDPKTGELIICGVGEYKFPMSYAAFDAGHVPWDHMTQCHIHMYATGSTYCDYISTRADEKNHGEWGEHEPEIKALMYATIHYSEGYMQLILDRIASFQAAVRHNKLHPMSPLVPHWGKIVFRETDEGLHWTARDPTMTVYEVEYEDKRHLTLMGLPKITVRIKYHPVTPQSINDEHVLRGWKDDSDPDGKEWRSARAEL